METFVFDLTEPVPSDIHLEGFEVQCPDELTLELTLTQAQSLNDVFAKFNEQGINVASMRNKSNRLEELFLSLVEHNEHKLTN